MPEVQILGIDEWGWKCSFLFEGTLILHQSLGLSYSRSYPKWTNPFSQSVSIPPSWSL